MNDFKSFQQDCEYVLLDLLGIGRMAEVYRCKQLTKNDAEKIIVIKKLLDHASNDTDAAACFIAEARLASLLHHENIAHIFDFGKIGTNYFIAMEYFFGQDLSSIMQRAKDHSVKLGTDEALVIIAKILDGMDYVHNLADSSGKPLHIMHRTISPRNIYVTYEGGVKIKGFGVHAAELSEACTRMGVIKGKIPYMAPEQLTDEKIDHRSDIFSIGILLYEMLSGRRMYVGDTAALIRKCMYAEYEKIETVRQGLTRDIYSIVNKALQLDRENRYQTCKQMREDIESFLVLKGNNRKDHKTELHELMSSLFASDIEAEKNSLYSIRKRFDKTYDNKADEKIDVTSYINTSDNTISLIDATNTLLVLDPHSTDFPKIKKPIWFLPNLSPLTKAAAIIGVTSVLILFFYTNRNVNDDLGVDTENAVVLQSYQEDSETGSKESTTLTDTEQIEQTKNDENIRSLLQQAESTLASGKEPEAELELAAIFYQDIQKIMPDNTDAIDGLRNISEKYAELTEIGLQNNYIAAAEKNVQKGLQLSPESSRLLTLYNLIEQEKSRIIESLEMKAQRAMELNKLTTPADDCAYVFYQEIQKIDRNNPTARQGIRLIGERYAELAEKSFRSYEIDKSREYVSKGLKVVPNNLHLLEIEEDLSKSGIGIFFQVIKKNFNEFME